MQAPMSESAPNCTAEGRRMSGCKELGMSVAEVGSELKHRHTGDGQPAAGCPGVLGRQARPASASEGGGQGADDGTQGGCCAPQISHLSRGGDSRRRAPTPTPGNRRRRSSSGGGRGSLRCRSTTVLGPAGGRVARLPAGRPSAVRQQRLLQKAAAGWAAGPGPASAAAAARPQAAQRRCAACPGVALHSTKSAPVGRQASSIWPAAADQHRQLECHL